VPIIYAGVNGLLDNVPVEKITQWEAEFRDHLTSTQGELLSQIAKGLGSEEIEKQIRKVVQDHVSSFVNA